MLQIECLHIKDRRCQYFDWINDATSWTTILWLSRSQTKANVRRDLHSIAYHTQTSNPNFSNSIELLTTSRHANRSIRGGNYMYAWVHRTFDLVCQMRIVNTLTETSERKQDPNYHSKTTQTKKLPQRNKPIPTFLKKIEAQIQTSWHECPFSYVHSLVCSHLVRCHAWWH